MTRGRGNGRSGGTKRPQLTHFLCLPLINSSSRPVLEASLASFRNGVADSLPSKAIRPVGALHCTLGVMSLSQRQLEAAIETLQACDVVETLRQVGGEMLSGDIKALRIDLQGLESMHEPHNTSILYVAPRDSTQRLLPFCLAVQAKFQEKSLLVSDDRPLRLHATIANTIYAKSSMLKQKVSRQRQDSSSAASEAPLDGSSGHGPNAKSSLRIDARGLLEQHKNYTWAENVTLDRIAICEMGAKKKYDEEGRLIGEEYKEVASIALPT